MKRLWVQLIASMALVSLICVGTMGLFSSLTLRQQIQALPQDVRLLFRDDGFVGPAVTITVPGTATDTTAATFPGLEQPPFAARVAVRLPRIPGDSLTLRPPRDGTFGPRNFRRNLEQAYLWSALVSMLVGAVLALFIVRRVARPIEAVSRATRRLAAGDLSARATVSEGFLSAAETQVLSHNFNRMAVNLEQLERERKSMIADVAHELRTPLTVMQSRLDALEDGVIPFSPEEVGRLSAQTQMLTRLVEDLRTLSLADAGRLSIRSAPLELAGVVSAQLEGFSPRFRERDIRLEHSLESGLWVRADPVRLSQVLTNLLENALRHTPSGGWVWLEASIEGSSPQDARVALRLTDSGPGIAPENLERVFDRFYREREDRGREGGGSGLGLAIVKILLELMGGRVWVHNAQGAGASFRVELPLLEAGHAERLRTSGWAAGVG